MSYEINYDDQKFKDVEADKKAAITDNDKLYSGMIKDSAGFYQDQIDAANDWEKKQTQLQQEQTDFAIQKIEQQKDQAKKDYTKEQSGAYVDWQKQSNEFGAEAEKRAAQGLENTGFSESSKVSMYNTYQNRVATARESYNRAVIDFNNSITQARLQNNSALAEIAYNALQRRLEFALQGFQYKNQLLLDQANKKTELEQIYHERWQDVLNQINTENALAEDIRQFNAQMAEEQRQFNQLHPVSSGGGGGGGSYSKKSGSTSKKSSSSSDSAKITKDYSSNNDASVNIKSVIDAGLAPSSGTTIANAVKSGTHTATQKGNQVYIEKAKHNINPTFGLLFSKKRF